MATQSEVGAYSIRDLSASDSIVELTALLHRAYARLAAMGLNYTAVDQDSETTVRRAGLGTCLVAELGGRLVGTLSVHGPMPESPCPRYRRPDVAVLEQFAVDPDVQGRGIGRALLAEGERRAASRGAAEALLDTAKPAEHLIRLYEGLGWGIVETVRWEGKTYESVVMAKRVGQIPAGPQLRL